MRKDYLYQQQKVLDDLTIDAIFERTLRSISIQAFNVIIACGIRDLDGMLSISEDQLYMIKGVKPGTVKEILKVRDKLRQKQQVYKFSRKQKRDKGFAKQTGLEKDSRTSETAERGLNCSSIRIPRELLNQLSNRTANVMRRQKIDTVGHLLSLSEQELISLPGAGCKTVEELLKFQKLVRKMYSYPTSVGEATRKNKYECTNYSNYSTIIIRSNKKETPYTCHPINLEEPTESSILRKALRELYDGANMNSVEFYECAERIRLSELGLSAQDLRKLRAVALYPEDSLADISSLTVGYIIETGISNEAFSALLMGLSKVFHHSHGVYFTERQLDDFPIICDSDVKGIANIRLDAFRVPKTIVTLMQSMRIITWRDTVGHSERNIVNMYGISAQSFCFIHCLWLLKKYAQDVRLMMPEEVYFSFESLVNYYVELGAKTPRQKTILKGRLGFLDGRQWTLEELGNIEGITRERVRQIEKKCIKKLQHISNKNKLQPLWDVISHILTRSGGVCLASELAESLANLWLWPSVPPGESVAVLVGASKIFQVIREPRLSIMMESCPCVNCLRVEQMLTRAIDESQGVLAVQEAGRILLESCKCECRVDTVEVASFSCGYVLHIAERSNIIKTDGNYLYNQIAWVYRYGQRNEMIEAIMQNCTHAMHFTEVYQKIREMRPDDESLSERYIHACMSNSPVLLLWDRGTFIHRSHVVIPYGLIHEIENYILERLNTGVPFISVSGVFKSFKERLVESGVPTESALYSCLRETGNAMLAYPEYPYVMLKENELQRLPLPFVLEQFVRNQQGVVSLDKIRDYLVGTLYVSEQLQWIYIYNIPNVIQVERAQFIHVDELNIDRDRLRPILDYIDSLLKSTNHVAVTKIFDDKKVTCKLLGISNPFMLYSVLQLFCSEQYDLSKFPRIRILGIGKKGKRTIGVSSEIADYIRKKDAPCSYDELFHHFVDELGYRPNTVYNVRCRDDVICYSQGAVVHLATLNWTDEKQQILEQVAAAHCSERERAGKPYGLITHLYEFAKLPELPVCAPWTTTLLGELLCRNGRFLIIGTQRNAFVPASNSKGIKSLSDLLYIILKEYYGGAANLSVFEKEMRDAGILQKSLTPMMLCDESLVTIKGNTVVLTELC
ncbi:MAG: sigma factor-like helix-turn-helix DNA-binding protein [Bacillota bacterium]|nr:sigma factor-like helix-turn-helix DNA-binding protein [Bacillota bacterium]